LTLGEKVQRFRTDRGMSPTELAKAAGISRPYLWQLETGGKQQPSFAVLGRLACALGVSVAEFGDPIVESIAGEDLPTALAAFAKGRGRELGVTQGDLEVMKNINFRGNRPTKPEDFELLFLFLQKWAQKEHDASKPRRQPTEVSGRRDVDQDACRPGKTRRKRR